MIKQPKFMVRIEGELATYDVPVNMQTDSVQVYGEIRKSLKEGEKVIAIYQNVGDEQHWSDLEAILSK